ncbi:transcription factor KUA1-like [Trifolium pratense]|uniref:transcription factor KUA1-like n=1 Tax=Trifolium pratense TaxID=57577 RepID=UPI001E6958DC|nr:transcription factor KUA1-like [Trifolium pratense]
MDQLSQINLNERTSIQDPSERQNVDTDMIESGSKTVIVNSNAKSSLIRAKSIPEETQDAANRAEPIPEETQADANREEKKRKHWKEDEHRQFLKGLLKYQRGQWKEISKEFVTTRSPSQIASHAQKYFDRNKDAVKKARKKRRSIHDTTIDNNGRLVILPVEKQNEIPSIERQQKEIPSHCTTLNVIPSIEQQNKISPLVTRSFHDQFNLVSHDSLNSVTMLITGSAGKPTQESHDIGDVGSSTISGIPKTTNDARVFCLSYAITSVLKQFYTGIIRCAGRFTVKVTVFL